MTAMKRILLNPAARPPVNGGRFEGWGSSFCWWANRIGYSDNLTEKAARLFYGKEEGELGLNIIRYNIGGGDDPSHRHIKRTDSAMPGYLVKQSDGSLAYDWGADEAQRKVLFAAVREAGSDAVVEAFSNSPPWFMCRSGCSSGAEKPDEDNLLPDQYEAFADYLASVAEHFKTDWGILFQSIDPMNEPASAYWGAMSEKQEGCHFEPGESQSRMLLAMKQALARHGLSDVILCATDETSIDVQIEAFEKLSLEARDAIGRIDTHTYLGSRRAELRELAVRNGKNLWMSEVDGGDVAGVSAGETGAALALARRIITDLNGLGSSAWILWQLIDSHISSEGMNGNKDSGMPDTQGGYWGIAVADHDRGEIVLTKKYWAFYQFSRFIRPGMYVLRPAGRADTADCLAAYDADSGSLVIVAVNYLSCPRFFTADISAFLHGGHGGVTIRAYRTSGSLSDGENARELGTARNACGQHHDERRQPHGNCVHTAPIECGRIHWGHLKARLRANSITTFVLATGQGTATPRI